ncbi:Late embryogenesis abundant protein, partial [Haemophilus influenzae]
IRKSK